MARKVLFNDKNREYLREKLANENFARTTCSFYKYVTLKRPETLRDELYDEWKPLSILGRTYIAKEGVNAQLSIPEQNWDEFLETLLKRPEFKNVQIKIAIDEFGKSFQKLIVRLKPKIVADGLVEKDFDPADTGKYLSAKKFNEAMDEKGTVVVDVRNYYESEVGYFENAIRPDTDTFRDVLPIIKNTLKGSETKKILLYCTGGIRCEKASAYLKYHEFQDVNQLQGGIIEYIRQVKEEKLQSKFKGKNFVFDKRMGERVTEDVLSRCHQCNEPSDDHTDCANQACHILFIQCESCRKQFGGCCSSECYQFSLLPIEKQRELRRQPNFKAPLLRFKDRVKPKLKELKN